MSDHLARLCFEGLGSTGRWTPHAYTLRLQGVEQSADHVVHLAHNIRPADHAECAAAVAGAADVLSLSVGGSIEFTGPPRAAS